MMTTTQWSLVGSLELHRGATSSGNPKQTCKQKKSQGLTGEETQQGSDRKEEGMKQRRERMEQRKGRMK